MAQTRRKTLKAKNKHRHKTRRYRNNKLRGGVDTPPTLPERQYRNKTGWRPPRPPKPDNFKMPPRPPPYINRKLPKPNILTPPRPPKPTTQARATSKKMRFSSPSKTTRKLSTSSGSVHSESINLDLFEPASTTTLKKPLSTKKNDFLDYSGRIKSFKAGYYTVPTLRDGNCFYSSYFRLAHIFKSDANLNIFPECRQYKMNEENWIQCFKNNLFTILSPPPPGNGAPMRIPLYEDELKAAAKPIFDILFEQALNDYVRNKINKGNDYLLNTSLGIGIYGDADRGWIDVFTQKMPQQLDIIRENLVFEHELYANLFNDINKDEVALTDNINIFLSSIEEGSAFYYLKNKIYYLFTSALKEKNKTKNYATQIEVSIIKNFIDILFTNDKAIIPIKKDITFMNITRDKELVDNEEQIQFIFYLTGLPGAEGHYEGMYSELALTLYLSKDDERFGFHNSQ